MSGGAYNYNYWQMTYLAELLLEASSERQESEIEYNWPRQRLARLLEHVAGLARTVEWVDSGDYGPERLRDVAEALARLGW